MNSLMGLWEIRLTVHSIKPYSLLRHFHIAARCYQFIGSEWVHRFFDVASGGEFDRDGFSVETILSRKVSKNRFYWVRSRS